MAFIKHSDGNIVGIVDGDDLTDDQKQAVKKSKEFVKQSDNELSDSSKVKKSGS